MPTNEMGREREARSELTSEEIGELERLCERHHTTWDTLDLIRAVTALPRLLTYLKRGKEKGSSAAAAAPIASTAEAFEAAAKVADDRYKIAREMRDDHGMRICTGISTAIRSLSPKGKNECAHDYEAEDDKGWRCKLCGHQT